MTEPTYEQLKARVAEYEAALERERKPDWNNWLHELADKLERAANSQDLASTTFSHDNAREAARQLRYMATCFTHKMNLVRYDMKIQEWWWGLKIDGRVGWRDKTTMLADMESFMSEHNIPLEKPIEL